MDAHDSDDEAVEEETIARERAAIRAALAIGVEEVLPTPAVAATQHQGQQQAQALTLTLTHPSPPALRTLP